MREYTGAHDAVTHHSVVAATTAHGRLRCLDLDWTWLTGRCRDLADDGVAAIAQPRSRHLSVTGVDRACHFLVEAATPNAAPDAARNAARADAMAAG